MAVYSEEFRFKLSKPIQYQGREADSSFKMKDTCEIILRAPNIKSHYRIGNILQALFTPAMLKAQKTMLEIGSISKIEKTAEQQEKDEEEKEKLSKETDKEKKEREERESEDANRTIVNFGILSLGKEINDFYDTFESLLLLEKICFLDESLTPFSQIELNELTGKNYDDFKKITNQYIANFFIASWMRSLGGN